MRVPDALKACHDAGAAAAVVRGEPLRDACSLLHVIAANTRASLGLTLA